MEELEEYFRALIREHRSVDIADAEFHKALGDDPELRAQYRQWCHEVGNTERNGFRDFCREYIETEDTAWDALTDYDDE